ncbi:MAG: AAA family ATPase [Treponema sp.]|nr:AAA family ATPase [Treponema sp.]
MFLKSLDIFGFKSFADRTHIDFSDGITALLGPNGCGKSNVVDAIKWVLAESKAKNLRAEKKEDVIFNGTERRSPLNVAEVTLTMSNENGLLPMDESEIAIKRRLYRSGENEYFINNRPVGAREVIKLFMDTGVGKSSYSIMEQGQVSQILSSKPEDRRYIFEEAAGISRSKAECAIAERELEQTRRNLQQIEIALAENKRRYDTLKVQAEKTSKFRDVKEQIFNCELDIALLRLRNFLEDQTRHKAELEEVVKKRDQVRAEIEEITNTISLNMDKVREMQELVYTKQAELVGLGQAKNGKMEMANNLNRQSRDLKGKIGALEARISIVQENLENIQEEIDEQEADIHKKEKQIAEVERNISEFEDNIKTCGMQITQNDQKSDEDRNRILQLGEERKVLQQELTSITENIVGMLDSKLKDAGFSAPALAKAKEMLLDSMGKLKVFAEGRKNVFSDSAKASHSESDAVKIIQEASDSFGEAEKLIADVENALDEYEKASPAFITEFLSPQGIMTKKRELDGQIVDNHNQIDGLNKEIEELRSCNGELSSKIDEYKETCNKLRVNKVQMETQIQASIQQASLLRRNLVSEQNDLRQSQEELAGEQQKAESLEDQIMEVQEELAELEHKGTKLAEELKELDSKIVESNSSVSGKKDKLQKKQEDQNRYSAQFERLTLLLNSAETEIRNLKQNFQESQSRDLMEFEERMYKITKPVAEIKDKLLSCREELRSLGNVNLMAVEEFAEEKDRYERQKANFDDTQKSLDNLIRVSEEIKSKSSEMFLETYNKIKKNFHNMFRRLFNGGRGELRLEDPMNVLTSGIEILAQPPGKKLENIALLSGGEKTMTAVALLFATYQVRPSPFCLLDEIDAALDDRNVSSFVTTLESFANVSQYIVITHNKKTVTGASTMLGITMEESGVSKIIALRLDEDIRIGSKVEACDDGFVEEDVPPEEGTFVPPRPPRRIYNDDGTITDPEIERIKKEKKEAEALERRKANEARKAALEEGEKSAFEKQEENIASAEKESGDKDGSSEEKA